MNREINTTKTQQSTFKAPIKRQQKKSAAKESPDIFAANKTSRAHLSQSDVFNAGKPAERHAANDENKATWIAMSMFGREELSYMAEKNPAAASQVDDFILSPEDRKRRLGKA